MNINKIREDFAVFEDDIIYFDNAATTFKPKKVVEKVTRALVEGVKKEEILEAKKDICSFLNISNIEEFHFIKGTTRAVNIIAHNLDLKEGDEVILSGMEHHSNLVPWQVACWQKKAKLRFIPLNSKGEIAFDEYTKLLNEKTKIVSVVHASNSLGTINPIKEMVKEAKKVNALFCVDGAQSTAHMKIDIEDIGCDFFVFSGHKVYAPTGIGGIYVKNNILKIEPYFNEPYILGLATALNYLKKDFDKIVKHEKELLNYALKEFKKLKIKIVGNSKERVPLISFYLDEVHPHDVATILNDNKICVRAGHHCTQPVMDLFEIAATTRISLSFYNTFEELDELFRVLKEIKENF